MCCSASRLPQSRLLCPFSVWRNPGYRRWPYCNTPWNRQASAVRCHPSWSDCDGSHHDGKPRVSVSSYRSTTHPVTASNQGILLPQVERSRKPRLHTTRIVGQRRTPGTARRTNSRSIEKSCEGIVTCYIVLVVLHPIFVSYTSFVLGLLIAFTRLYTAINIYRHRGGSCPLSSYPTPRLPIALNPLYRSRFRYHLDMYWAWHCPFMLINTRRVRGMIQNFFSPVTRPPSERTRSFNLSIRVQHFSGWDWIVFHKANGV